jgi:hypothetical protein
MTPSSGRARMRATIASFTRPDKTGHSLPTTEFNPQTVQETLVHYKLEGILDAQVGNSKDQFCSEVFGNVNCD